MIGGTGQRARRAIGPKLSAMIDTENVTSSRTTLWTWQGSEIRIDRDSVCHSRSGMLKDCPNLQPKYEAVLRRTKIRPLWCLTEYQRWHIVKERPLVLWKLCVPKDAIIGYVDEWVADRLLNAQPCPNPVSCRQWRQEACRKHPWTKDAKDGPSIENCRRKFIEAMLAKYEGTYLDQASGWDQIFVEEAEQSAYVSALLPSPVPSEWVIERPPTPRRIGDSVVLVRPGSE